MLLFFIFEKCEYEGYSSDKSCHHFYVGIVFSFCKSLRYFLVDISILAGEKDTAELFGGKLAIRSFHLQPATHHHSPLRLHSTLHSVAATVANCGNSHRPPIIIIPSLSPSADPVIHLHYAAAINVQPKCRLRGCRRRTASTISISINIIGPSTSTFMSMSMSSPVATMTSRTVMRAIPIALSQKQ